MLIGFLSPKCVIDHSLVLPKLYWVFPRFLSFKECSKASPFKIYSTFHNLQIDYNLYGMGHLHISKLKFRHPVPVVYSHRKFKYNDELRTSRDDSTCMDLQVSLVFLLPSLVSGFLNLIQAIL